MSSIKTLACCSRRSRQKERPIVANNRSSMELFLPHSTPVRAANPPSTPSTPFQPSTPLTSLLSKSDRIQKVNESPFWQSVHGILDDSSSNPLDMSLDRSLNSIMQDAEAVLEETQKMSLSTGSRSLSIATECPFVDLEKLSEQLLQLLHDNRNILGTDSNPERERLLALQANLCRLRDRLNMPSDDSIRIPATPPRLESTSSTSSHRPAPYCRQSDSQRLGGSMSDSVLLQDSCSKSARISTEENDKENIIIVENSGDLNI